MLGCIAISTGGFYAYIQAAPSMAPHRSTLTLEWMFVGVIVPVYIAFVAALGALRDRLSFTDSFIRPFWAAATIGTMYVIYRLAFVPHRRYLLVIAIFHIAIVTRAFDRPKNNWWLAYGFVSSAAIWTFGATLTFTPIADLLMSAGTPFGLTLPVFAVAFAFVATQLASDTSQAALATPQRVGGFIFAGTVFLWLALRIDNITTDYGLYHRGYYTAPAELVRSGHWLLWDVPSQYGFLSILSLAVFPARNAWQALYLESAAILLLQAMALFAILRHRSPGAGRYVFALLVTSGVFFSSEAARFPFGPRIYPQIGLRFFWLNLLLLTAFAMFNSQTDRRRARLRLLGSIVWILASLWSFEVAVWATITWLGYVTCETISDCLMKREIHENFIRFFAGRFWPFAILPTAAYGIINGIYFVHLGHGADFIGYVEFSLTYALDASYSTAINLWGPGWFLLLIMASIGTCAVACWRSRKYDVVPLLAIAWLATWVSSSYYAGEAWDNHVKGVLQVVAFASAIVLVVARESLPSPGALIIVRQSFAPMFVLLITTAFGETGYLATIQGPMMPYYDADPLAAYPVISGELASLIRTARIAADDPLVIASGALWTKLTTGIILPLAIDRGGTKREYRSWLPMSPWGNANTVYSLTTDRRQTYIERFLDMTPSGGWYITYRKPARCNELSLRLINVRVVESRNFRAALCRYRALQR